jgi:hypothetical protein
MSKENQLAKLVDDDKLIELVRMDEFLALVNLEPPASFVKDHPFTKNVKFMPIDKIELLLTKLFQEWRVEVLREGQLFNSVYVAVRLHYKHPFSGWTWQDGYGAVPVKTKQGAAASDMGAILNDAIMTGLPAAESFAVKDAAEKIGKLFGKDLNRRDTLGFTPSYGTDDVKSDLEKKKQEIKEKLDANHTPKQEDRPTGVEGNAPIKDHGQEQQDDQAPQ